MERFKKSLIVLTIAVLMVLSQLAGMGGTLAYQVQNQGGGHPESGADQAVTPVTPSGETAKAPSSGNFGKKTTTPPAETAPTAGEDKAYNCHSKICGTKFVDLDYDSKWDAGEPGLAGVIIKLYKDGVVLVGTQSTDANGNFCFSNLVDGSYTVIELGYPGYYATTLTFKCVSICRGETKTVIFGNATCKKISGYKFEDLNGNSVWEQDEPAIEGWEIALDGEDTVKTDTNGYFEFGDLESGTYVVSEEAREGWFNTTPASVQVEVGCGGGDRVTFGNCRYGKISGTKYEDSDDSGTISSGDAPVENVTVNLWKGAVLVDTKLTDGSDGYEFTGLLPGDYTVEEILPDGTYALTPVTVNLNIVSGDAETADFLNALMHCSIAGTKWSDLDADGVADLDELGLGGVIIQLWSGGELLEEMVAGADGSYFFEDLEPGDYTAAEVVPADSYSTSPESIDVSLEPDEDVTGIDFLNAPYGSISGTKWDDPNRDGVHQPDEAGVKNVTITLTQGGKVIATTSTGDKGAYSFENLKAGDYEVTETLPSGTTNTTPIKVTVTPTTETETTTGGAQLPLTGFDLLPWILAAGLLMLLGLLSLALGMVRSRR